MSKMVMSTQFSAMGIIFKTQTGHVCEQNQIGGLMLNPKQAIYVKMSTMLMLEHQLNCVINVDKKERDTYVDMRGYMKFASFVACKPKRAFIYSTAVQIGITYLGWQNLARTNVITLNLHPETGCRNNIDLNKQIIHENDQTCTGIEEKICCSGDNRYLKCRKLERIDSVQDHNIHCTGNPMYSNWLTSI